MPDSLPVFAQACPAPRLEIASPTLAVAMPTAMVLVDYALAGLTTPTSDPSLVAGQLPADLVRASHPVRAVLAHGTVLRDVLLAQLPSEHKGHTSWPALRRWLAGLDDARVLGLVEFGAYACLAYDQPADAGDTAQHSPRDAAEVRGTRAALRRDVTAVLESWPVPRAARRSAELLDPASVRDTLLELLDAIWELWLEDAWREQLPALRAQTAAGPPPPGCGGAQWISVVTGLRPEAEYAEAADQARRVTLMPCPGLGRSLSLVRDEDDIWVLYSPAYEPGPDAGADDSAARPSRRRRSGISVGRLGSLAPAMRALGDRTRLAIVLQLLDDGPLTMAQLVDAVGVHQSTVSRQVAALRDAGLVEVDDQRYIAVNRVQVRQVCRTLLDALE
ncbi:ArsR/SmtB family transcription factor [Actinopolymorpha cephalotaxi]|nr:helix-turn-helix domain-containing protein [Actinopolymorpha cephalotaxi]NYH81562.1 DNA-binding transcriptional ArsR family regulator [Actinopolymorpha cephalotaxi]